MDKLKLPIISKKIPDSKCLSMDDYLKFVELNLKYTLNRDVYRKWSKKLAVTVPFVWK